MNKMINRYKSKEGGTMIPLRFQNGGSNLFLTMPNGGNVGPLGASPMGLPEYQTGANYGYPMMQDGGDADMDGDDQSFYSNRMNTFIQKIRDAAEKNLETAIMEQDQEQPMAAYGMSMNSDPMNSYDPGNLGAFAKTANYMKDLGKGAVSGYIQRMGALGPNDYYYKEKNIYKDTSKNAPLGSQLFTDADGNQSMISPEEAYNRSNYALYSSKRGGSLPTAQKGRDVIFNDRDEYNRAMGAWADSTFAANSTDRLTDIIRRLPRTNAVGWNKIADVQHQNLSTSNLFRNSVTGELIDPIGSKTMHNTIEHIGGSTHDQPWRVDIYARPETHPVYEEMPMPKMKEPGLLPIPGTETGLQLQNTGLTYPPVNKGYYYMEPSDNPGVGVVHYKKDNKDGTFTTRVVGPSLAKDWYNDEDQRIFQDNDPNTRVDSRIDYDPRDKDKKVYGSMAEAYQEIEKFREAEKQKRKKEIQKKKGGESLPMAQDGLAGIASAINDPALYRRALEMGHNSIDEYKNSNWGYGKNHPQYKAQGYPSRIHINDPRTINATTGNPINDRVDLNTGDYHTGVIGQIARAAKEYNLDANELMAMGLQESSLGKRDPNYGHVLNYADPQRRGPAYDMAYAKSEKNKEAERLGYKDNEVYRIQTYNGLGRLYPETEAKYHGYIMDRAYGVPLPKEGISMLENPLYGKRIMDLRDNVLKDPANAKYQQFLDKYNRDLANEEAVSQKQIGMYNMFNSISPEYGNKFRDMIQGAYNDSIPNNSFETFYPGEDLEFNYSVPNLDYDRQQHALDRFNKGIGFEQIPFKEGGALTKYQQEKNSGQPGTTGGDYWTAEETAYLNTLPKAQRDAIISKGDKGREAYQAYRKANDKPASKPASVNKSTTATQPSATANNTGTGVTTTNTTVPNGSQTIGGNGDPNMLYDGHNNSTNENTTVINGVRYAVDPVTREVLGYNPQSSTGTQNYNNYNPYATYGSMRGRNLGVISKNRLTPEFKENMLAGSYGNPQLLGVSEIKTRRAMDPGNRVKSITYSYGQPIPGGRTTVNAPAPSNSAPGKSSSTTPNKPTSAPVNPSASTLTPEQKIQQAMDFTFRPGQGPYNTAPDFPGLEKPRVGPWDADADSWSNPSGYVYPTNTSPNINTDPNVDKSSNIDPATDPRGANYGKEDYPEDLKLDESGVVVKGSDNNWYVKMPDGTIQKSMDREVLRKKTGFAKGGSLHRFMRAYQDGGPFSVREMTIGDMPETVDQIVEPESNNTPMDFNPYEMTDADRIRAVDVGTEYEQLEPGDGMAPSFDVTTKRRKKRIGNPEKDLAFINMAKKLFNRDAAYADTEYRRRSQASENFNPMRSTEGNYDVLSGDFRRGKRAADGNDAFHSGFGNYAQMGGSMLENLKEGDEVYLTEEQINEIVKRGGKLSYL